MPSILLRTENMDKIVLDLILDKQLEFRKEKGRPVSLDKTVNKLIKDAYLNKLKNANARAS